jgi:hypothetical protein
VRFDPSLTNASVLSSQDATDEVIGEVELLLKETADLKEKGQSRPLFGGEAIAVATALTVSLRPVLYSPHLELLMRACRHLVVPKMPQSTPPTSLTHLFSLSLSLSLSLSPLP